MEHLGVSHISLKIVTEYLSRLLSSSFRTRKGSSRKTRIEDTVAARANIDHIRIMESASDIGEACRGRLLKCQMVNSRGVDRALVALPLADQLCFNSAKGRVGFADPFKTTVQTPPVLSFQFALIAVAHLP
jgi:hypothetical protein